MMYLNDEQLQQLPIRGHDIVASIESTLRGVRTGDVTVAPKTANKTSDGRYMMATLAGSDSSGLVAVKSVLVNNENRNQGLPSINGAIMLLDAQTGQLRAMFDANWVTAVRTAGLSAVAASRLANPKSAVLGLLGAGVQALSHISLFSELYPIQRVLVSGRSQEGVGRIHAHAKSLGLAAETATAEQVVARADVLISCISLDFSIKPFLDAGWLRPGSFASILDQALAWQPASLHALNDIYIDDRVQEQALGKPLAPAEKVAGDLTDLVLADTQWQADKRMAFVFRGIAAGDLAVAALAYSIATHTASA